MKGGGSKFATSTSGSWKKLFEQVKVEAQECLTRRIERIAVLLNEKLMEKTPVWSGSTIRNWNWSIGAPDMDVHEPEGQGTPPGPTNSMSIGSEPRRGENISAQKLDFEVFLAELRATRQVEMVYLTNASKAATLVEYGLAPGGPDQVVRAPSGVLRVSIQELLIELR